MADKQYIYRGPPSGATLRIGEGKGSKTSDVLFFDGGTITLPAEHPYVKRLVARGHLTEVTKETPKASTSTTVSTNAAGSAANTKGSNKESV